MSHSRLSPSSAHRWMLCPGSVREENKYPDSSSAAAIDGTHTHTLLETCIKNDLVDPASFIDKEMSDHEGSFIVDAERASRVRVAVEYIRQRKEELGVVAIHAEEQVNPEFFMGRDDMKGTADVRLVTDTMIEVIDYKDGMSPVQVKDNPQLAIYALGSMAPYSVEGQRSPFEKVKLTVIQPKLELKGMQAITSAEYDLDNFMVFCGIIRSKARETDPENAPLVAGEKQCKWCKAKGNCSVLADKALTEAQVMFEQVGMAQQAADKNPEELSDEKVREILEAKPLITEFLAAVEAEAMRRFETGHAVPGLKVVRGRGSRKYSLKDDEIAKKLKGMGMPKDVIYQAKLISPAQLKKVTWENRSGEKKQLSEKQLKRIEDNFITKSQGKMTIALESDSRAEVPMAAADIFKNVVTEETVETVETEKPQLPDWML